MEHNRDKHQDKYFRGFGKLFELQRIGDTLWSSEAPASVQFRIWGMPGYLFQSKGQVLHLTLPTTKKKVQCMIDISGLGCSKFHTWEYFSNPFIRSHESQGE